MTDFERSLVRGFMDYFDSDEHDYVSGYAMRDKQSKYQEQVTDVMVFKPDCFIECKSVKTSSSGGVGFRSHFGTEEDGNDDRHQIQRETDILNKTGFKGVLGLELRRGRGKPRKAFLIDWQFIYQRWDDEQENNSVRFHELEELCEDGNEFEASTAIELDQEDGDWVIDSDVYEWLMQIHG